MAAEHAVERAAAEELCGCAFGYAFGGEHPEAVGVEERGGDVVRGEEHGLFFFAGYAAKEREHVGGGCGVEVGGGFVEEHHGGLLREGFGDVHALALSVGEGAYGPLGEGCCFGECECAVHGAAVGFGTWVEERGVGQSAGTHHVACGECLRCGLCGEHYGYVACPFLRGEARGVGAAVEDGSREGRLEGGEGAQECALSLPVGSHEGGDAWVERGGESGAHGCAAIACGEVGEGEHGGVRVIFAMCKVRKICGMRWEFKASA